MKAHELAYKLLELPDIEVVVEAEGQYAYSPSVLLQLAKSETKSYPKEDRIIISIDR